MPFIPVPAGVLVEVRGILDDQQVENTLWFRALDPVDVGALTNLNNAVSSWVNLSLNEAQSEDWHGREVVCTSMETETDLQVSLPITSYNGHANEPSLANALSITASFRTGQRGRAHRGRNYVVGIPSGSMLDPNHVNSTYITTVIDAYTDLIAPVLDVGFQWCVCSRYSGVDPDTHKPIPRVAGVLTTVTNVIIVDNIIDTQRRRGPGRGD